MKRTLCMAACTAALALVAALAPAQSLPSKWEDLTASDFVKALKQSSGVCLMPLGSIEKFGPSGPLGTNVYLGRLVALEAAKQEYAIVFPEYYASATTSASTLPGTIAYSPRLQYELLDETVNEMGRNGCKKVVIVNAHSGNTGFLSYFLSNFNAKPHNFSLYTIYGPEFPVFAAQYAKLPAAMQPSAQGVDGHGGEERIAALLAYYPELVHLDRAHDEPVVLGHGAPNEGAAPKHIGSGFMETLPTGYSGDAGGATAARGRALVEYVVNRLVKVVRDVKSDGKTMEIQNKFVDLRANPSAAK